MVDADLDLWHGTTHENWSTFGVTGVRDSDFVLIIVSDAYRERWEETGDSEVGAGAAREANAIKSLFDLDRAAFRRKVKVVLLPGARVDDIPLELLSSTERFRVETFDLAGLTPLLRSLHGRPDLVKPPLGPMPPLPPAFVADVDAAVPDRDDLDLSQAPHDDAQAVLGRRLAAVDAALKSAATDHPAYEREALEAERGLLAATLSAVERAVETAANPSSSLDLVSPRTDEVQEATDRAVRAIADAQSAMAGLPDLARESLFQYFRSKAPLTVGGNGDAFGIDAAITAEENGYVNWVEDADQMVTPRAAHPRVAAAMSALQDARAYAFGGDSLSARARAAPWARLLLQEKYGVEDPEFELRPLWVTLGFLRR
jgi:hypothetical protein